MAFIQHYRMCISENWMLLTVVSVATTQSTLDKFSQNFRVGNQYQIDDNIFGTNDAYDYINEIQTVELDRYKDNLSVMVQMVLDKNIKPIIIGPCMTPRWQRPCLLRDAQSIKIPQLTKDY